MKILNTNKLALAALVGSLALTPAAFAAGTAADAPQKRAVTAEKAGERGKLSADEKARLEQALGTGQDRNYYRPALEKMGYTVTSVNDSDANHLEMEVVKGDYSYEVKVDFDKTSRKSTKVDVAANLWETEATEKAKGEK